MTDLQTDLIPVHRLWWWRVRVEAEYVPLASQLVSVPFGPWIVGGTPASPSANWIIAGTPAAPSPDTITAGTPVAPASIA
jgi:hypothetical protein